MQKSKTTTLHAPPTLTTPTVSIIMAAYNATTTIKSSINSILSQTYINWELIVVDDCSSDDTVAIVELFAESDSRIRLYINEQNSGVATTRNVAISQAQGKWLAFLDSDDLWHKDKLEQQLQFSEESGAVISYTATSYIDSKGNMSDYILTAEPELSYKTLLRRNIMSCSSVMVQRDNMIPFPDGYMHEDYAVWMQIIRNSGNAYGLDEPLLIYRIAENSKSSNRLRSARMTFNSYRKVGYSVFVAWLLTLRYSVHSITKRLAIRLDMRESR